MGNILTILSFVMIMIGTLLGLIGYLISPNDNLYVNMKDKFSSKNIIKDSEINNSTVIQTQQFNGDLNIGNNQRHLSDEDIKSLNQSISEQSPDLIKITSNSNMESYQYAKDVQQFLVSKGYKVEGVYQTMLAGGPIGIHTQSEGENIMGVYVN